MRVIRILKCIVSSSCEYGRLPLESSQLSLAYLSSSRSWDLVSRASITPCLLPRSKDGGSGGLFNQLMTPITPAKESSSSKVTVVGAGSVGLAAAFSLLTMNVSSDVCLVDMDEKKVKGEAMDLQHGSLILGNSKVTGSNDYAISANSRICVITAGVRQKEGESRLNLVQRNTEVLAHIIPQLLKYSPNAILLLVSNPVDILTYVAWKLSKLPKNRVIGSGCSLDSSRFRYFMAQRLKVGVSSVHGWIIGEHGDSSVPVWSGVNVAGMRLRELNPALGTDKDPDHWQQIHKDVINGAMAVIKMKGYTNWAIGLCVASLCQPILRNTNCVHSVTTSLKGEHNIDKEVFLSLPCVLGENGVTYIVKQKLAPDELAMLQKSANLMWDILSKLKI